MTKDMEELLKANGLTENLCEAIDEPIKEGVNCFAVLKLLKKAHETFLRSRIEKPTNIKDIFPETWGDCFSESDDSYSLFVTVVTSIGEDAETAIIMCVNIRKEEVK